MQQGDRIGKQHAEPPVADVASTLVHSTGPDEACLELVELLY